MVKGEFWEAEFGAEYEPEAPILGMIQARGVRDVSWHHDVAPHLEADLNKYEIIELWFDHPDPGKRQTGEKRYLVRINSKRGVNPRNLLETDSAQRAASVFCGLSGKPCICWRHKE